MWNKDEKTQEVKKGASEDLRRFVNESEKILWEGKPNKKCYIFESVFNPLLPFALLWGILDFTIIGFTFGHSDGSGMALILLVFFAFHLMPVWLYLAGVLLTFRRYRHTYYIVTDNAIYVSGGAFVRTYNTKPFAELSHIDLHRGIFDQWFNVGDIIATSSQMSTDNKSASIRIDSISDYDKVYKIVSKLQKDIYTDVMYPNELRPTENKGYRTKYKGDEE